MGPLIAFIWPSHLPKFFADTTHAFIHGKTKAFLITISMGRK